MCNKNDEKEPLSTEDQFLWNEFVAEHKNEIDEGEKEIEIEDFEALLNEFENPITEPSIEDPSSIKKEIKNISKIKKHHRGSEIDLRTEEKLRKGKLKIEARLDLHGKIQSEAYEALTKFIQLSLKKKHRCVLIITGKGKSRISTKSIIEPEVGILKQKLPQWLSTDLFQSSILRIMPAHIKDGGSGAFYVYLRRQR